MTTKNNNFMGIDVSKATLDISVRGKHSKINNSRAAINSFINDQLAGVDIRLCVLESTGGYERLVITMLNEANIPVHRAHPNKVYAFAKACGHFAKTDKLDSKLLEKYAEFIKDKNVVCIELTKELIDLQGLRAVQKNLEGELHANQCRTKYMVALVAAFSNDKMKKKYKELIEKGKAAKVALTAIMRKIIVCLNAMIKNNKLYEV